MDRVPGPSGDVNLCGAYGVNDYCGPRARPVTPVFGDGPEGTEPPPINKVLGAHGPLLKVLKDIAEADDPIIRREIRLVIHGQYTIIGYSGVPIYGKDGSRLGSALLFQDITPFVTQLA